MRKVIKPGQQQRTDEDDVPIPNGFECSITGVIMTDPVFTVDGHSYEREDITKWLENHDTSPKTNKKLWSKLLMPNHDLRKAIQDFLKQSLVLKQQMREKRLLEQQMEDVYLGVGLMQEQADVKRQHQEGGHQPVLPPKMPASAEQLKLQNKLVVACRNGDEKQVTMLLEQGAKPNVTTAQGEQPLGAAVYGMCPGVVDAILKEAKGIAPMTWEECEKHNRKYYEGEVFIVPKFNPNLYNEWYTLLKKIEQNTFVREWHLNKVNDARRAAVMRERDWNGLIAFVIRKRDQFQGSVIRRGHACTQETEKGYLGYKTQIQEWIKTAKRPIIPDLKTSGGATSPELMKLIEELSILTDKRDDTIRLIDQDNGRHNAELNVAYERISKEIARLEERIKSVAKLQVQPTTSSSSSTSIPSVTPSSSSSSSSQSSYSPTLMGQPQRVPILAPVRQNPAGSQKSPVPVTKPLAYREPAVQSLRPPSAVVAGLVSLFNSREIMPRRASGVVTPSSDNPSSMHKRSESEPPIVTSGPGIFQLQHPNLNRVKMKPGRKKPTNIGFKRP